MFDVSWGELAVVVGLGFVVIGKKDLPKAAGMVGNRLGRIVGLLQGARARADTFAQQTELKQLHNELKSGLRELDAVKSEMAVAMSSRGMQGIGSGGGGGGGGAMISRTVLSSSSSSTPQAPQLRLQQPQSAASGAPPPLLTSDLVGPSPTTTPTTSTSDGSLPQATSGSGSVASAVMEPSPPSPNHPSQIIAPPPPPPPTTTTTFSGNNNISNELPPESQTIAAVAEDEWMKQGIGFKSRAERGVGLKGYSAEDANNPLNNGSSILAYIYQQNLIFDQYDRVVQEQDSVLQSKIDEKMLQKQQQTKDKEQEQPHQQEKKEQ